MRESKVDELPDDDDGCVVGDNRVRWVMMGEVVWWACLGKEGWVEMGVCGV